MCSPDGPADRMQKIAILYDASQAVISTFDLDEVLSQILSIVRDYFHLQHAAVLLLDAEAHKLHVRSHGGWNRESVEAEVPLGRGLRNVGGADAVAVARGAWKRRKIAIGQHGFRQYAPAAGQKVAALDFRRMHPGGGLLHPRSRLLQ